MPRLLGSVPILNPKLVVIGSSRIIVNKKQCQLFLDEDHLNCGWLCGLVQCASTTLKKRKTK